MFTWICPQCGREVPPSYSECPDCTAKTAAPSPVPSAVQPQPPPPPPAQYAQPVYQQPPPQYYQPPPRRSYNTWLVTLGVAAGLTAAGAGVYYFLPSTRAQREAQEPETALETPATAASPAASARLAKNIEIAGLRIVEEKKKPILRFLVVNHSAAEIADLEGSIRLHASNAAPGSDPISIVKLKVPTIGPHESKEVSTPIKTSLRAYELPDWQFLRADLELTSQ